MIEYNIVWASRFLLVILCGECAFRYIRWWIRARGTWQENRLVIALLGVGLSKVSLFGLFVTTFIIEHGRAIEVFSGWVRVFWNLGLCVATILLLQAAWLLDCKWSGKRIAWEIIIRLSIATALVVPWP